MMHHARVPRLGAPRLANANVNARTGTVAATFPALVLMRPMADFTTNAERQPTHPYYE